MTYNGRPIRIQHVPFPVKTCGGATIRRPAGHLVLVNLVSDIWIIKCIRKTLPDV